MKDWFDEWLNSPPMWGEDNDRDGYYQSNYAESYFFDEEWEEPSFNQKMLYLGCGAIVYALVGMFLVLMIITGLLGLIAVILNFKIAMWASALALTALALWWSKKGTRQ